MNKLAMVVNKFAVVDATKAMTAATGGGGAGAFLRIKKDDPKTFIRFLPPLLDADGNDAGPPVMEVKWHYIPSSSGKTKCVPCFGMRGRTCPLCEFDNECRERIGTEGRPGSKRREYSLPSSKYGVGASRRYLANVVMSRVNTDVGGFEVTGPHVLEMPSMLMEKVFGIAWKTDTLKDALINKADENIFDLNASYWVEVSAVSAPTFFNVGFKSDRSGKRDIGPLFTEDNADLADKVLAGIKDLSTLITWPEEEVYTDGLTLLRQELNEIAGDVDDSEIQGEVIDARTVAAKRKASSAALSAPASAASRLSDDDDDDIVVTAPRRSARAAVQSVDLDDDI